MVTSDGAICSAIDADSEGVEGKYYVWKSKEIDDLLQNDSSRFKSIFGVTEEGNFEGSNILFFKKAFSDRNKFNDSGDKPIDSLSTSMNIGIAPQ